MRLGEQRPAHKVVVGAGQVTVISQIPKKAPQLLDRCKQKRRALPRRGCPSSGQTGNPSVVFLWSNEKSPQFSLRRFPVLVDGKGIEPSTSAMRTPRSPKCDIARARILAYSNIFKIGLGGMRITRLHPEMRMIRSPECGITQAQKILLITSWRGCKAFINQLLNYSYFSQDMANYLDWCITTKGIFQRCS